MSRTSWSKLGGGRLWRDRELREVGGTGAGSWPVAHSPLLPPEAGKPSSGIACSGVCCSGWGFAGLHKVVQVEVARDVPCGRLAVPRSCGSGVGTHAAPCSRTAEARACFALSVSHWGGGGTSRPPETRCAACPGLWHPSNPEKRCASVSAALFGFCMGSSWEQCSRPLTLR